MDISTAKFRLYNKSPFLGTIVFNLPVTYSEEMPTLGVDGLTLTVNKAFWDKHTPKQQLMLLAHECGHLFLGHIWRRGARTEMAIDPKTGQTALLWNIAADFAVNPLAMELLTGMPQTVDRDYEVKGMLWDKKYFGWATEKIYDDLKKRMKSMSASQAKEMMDKEGECCKKKWYKPGGKEKKDGEGKDSGKGMSKAEQEARMKQIIGQATEKQRQKGTMPSALERLVEDLEPREDWRKALIEYAEPFSNDYNFQKPDRRYLDEDFYLPDIQDEGEKIDWIAVAIDTSGSIGGDELANFVGEIKGIMKSFDKVKVKLTFCDAVASPFVTLDEFDASLIKPTGGGGTDFRPVFDLVRKEDTMPHALLYFTDMMGDFPSKAPRDFDVLWLSTTRGYKAPFGKVLEYPADTV